MLTAEHAKNAEKIRSLMICLGALGVLGGNQDSCGRE
jgi:hypothetical protein